MAVGTVHDLTITMENIREKLLMHKVFVLSPAVESMEKLGYTKEDIIHGIMLGKITKKQVTQGESRYVIKSLDTDLNPIVLIVAKTRFEPDYFSVLTIFPPIKNDT